jgi:hypothetical protein
MLPIGSAFSKKESMTPRDFLQDIVRPNVSDFYANVGSLRYAHNAVSAVDSLAAHLYVWAIANNPAAVSYANDDSHFRSSLASRDPSFALLRDIAKAQKHVHLTKHNPQVRRAEQIASRSIGWGEGDYDEGRFGGEEQVVVDIGPGKFFYVEKIIDSSLAFLEAEMTRIGV